MRARSNLVRVLVFAGLVHTPMFVPVVVLFWQDNGLDLQDVYLLQALYAVAVVLLEVPTGMISDRMGKRTSLLVATATFSLALVGYGLGTGFWHFLAAELALAFASAFLSGADTALLYDTLKAEGRQEEFTLWDGRARGIQLLSFALANILGGLVATVSLRATVGLSAIGPALALLVALGFVEVNPPRVPDSLREAWLSYVALLRASVRFVGRHRLVRWYLSLLAVLTGSSTWLLWLYQPYMTFAGVPVWAFGLVFALYNLWAAGVSAAAGRIAEVLGERGTLVALALLQWLPLPLLATVVGPASFLFVLGHQSVRGLGRPFLAQRILAHTWADKRSTVLSLGALGSRLLFALTAPLVGWSSEHLTLPQALWVQAALLGALLVGLALQWPWIDAKYRQVKPEPEPS